VKHDAATAGSAFNRCLKPLGSLNLSISSKIIFRSEAPPEFLNFGKK
jgi:hypothetical protein